MCGTRTPSASFRGNGAIASATPNETLLKLFHDKLAR
jgi:hypothetical protein